MTDALLADLELLLCVCSEGHELRNEGPCSDCLDLVALLYPEGD
jgi:hypothetical protein